MHHIKAIFFVFLILTTAITGCTSYQPEQNSYSDPLVSISRPFFNLNYYVLDPYLFRPVALLWKNYMPMPIRHGLVNVSFNLSEPASVVNNLLQGEGHQAGVHFARFFLNTVFGFAGLFDVASLSDPQLANPKKRTFGNMLGSYGVPYGPSGALPIYNFATLRDDGGHLVDGLYSPLTFIGSFPLVAAKIIIDSLEYRATAIAYEPLLEQSDDPYNFIRNAYFQAHDFDASNNKIGLESQIKREKVIENFIDDIDAL